LQIRASTRINYGDGINPTQKQPNMSKSILLLQNHFF